MEQVEVLDRRRPCVEIRTPAEEWQRWVSRELRRIFDDCGFEVRVGQELSSPARGVCIEAHPTALGEAELLGQAFQNAGVRVRSLRNERCSPNVIVLRLGQSETI